MKRIQVLGPGCPTCRKLADMAEYAAKELKIDFELEKVTEIERIVAFDVAGTPALIVDGEVKVVGRVPSVNELKAMFA